MTLVDTSVWVDHFRRGNPALEALLLDGEVLCHPFVIGELACGNLKRRSETLACYALYPTCPWPTPTTC
jgi:predicted nucleic acid-binding protein